MVDFVKLKVQSRARKFANKVKESQFAWTIPDEDIDALTDDELKLYQEFLIQFGLVKRPDWKWEKK